MIDNNHTHSGEWVEELFSSIFQNEIPAPRARKAQNTPREAVSPDEADWRRAAAEICARNQFAPDSPAVPDRPAVKAAAPATVSAPSLKPSAEKRAESAVAHKETSSPKENFLSEFLHSRPENLRHAVMLAEILGRPRGWQ